MVYPLSIFKDFMLGLSSLLGGIWSIHSSDRSLEGHGEKNMLQSEVVEEATKLPEIVSQ